MIITSVATWLFQGVEYLRIDSPDRQYQMIVTYRRMESFRPTFPDQSGDKAGFIRIVDKAERTMEKLAFQWFGCHAISNGPLVMRISLLFASGTLPSESIASGMSLRLRRSLSAR